MLSSEQYRSGFITVINMGKLHLLCMFVLFWLDLSDVEPSFLEQIVVGTARR